MPTSPDAIRRFFATHHPFDVLEAPLREAVAAEAEALSLPGGAPIYAVGERVQGLYAIAEGSVEISAETGETISHLHAGECFGERGLLLDGEAPYTARMREPGVLYRVPAERFLALVRSQAGFARFFGRKPAEASAGEDAPSDVSLMRMDSLMSRDPVGVAPTDTVAEAAGVMHGRGISCVLVSEDGAAGGRLVGLLTTGDLCGRVLATGLPGTTPVGEVMTAAPLALPADALGVDAVVLMLERGIGHLPVVEPVEGGSRAVGIVTRTNLLLHRALSLPVLLGEIARREALPELAATVAKVPELLARMVGAGLEHHRVTRLVTDVTDALTRRLIALAEAELGPPPVPYLWAACGSQGRQEQTGVSDQDNCLILSGDAQPGHDSYFEALARRVCDGLNACGFVYCPGDMMAINPRWRQPLPVWRRYFEGWIRTPDPEARMLASVMFDLRAIAGDATLLAGLQADTLAAARRNSIFIAHMVANSLTHQPPLGLFRGFSLTRSGEHKGSVDLKLAGVVPVVDLARLYALMGGLAPVGTRARLEAAREAGLVSPSGGQDLLAAYDLIAERRLMHQTALIRDGRRPDNHLVPATLSDLERNHLRNAFIVVKTMQAAVAQGRHTVV